jgi:hypothetical protein
MVPTDEQQPLSTQGNNEEKENQLGGTTNLSLDDLKKEGDPEHTVENNPDRIDNADDLHEIQVDDDLDEPDIDECEPDNADEQYSEQEQQPSNQLSNEKLNDQV